VSFTVPEKTRPIIDNVSLKLNTGDIILLNGDSGSGKSTLLKIIAGVLVPDKGSIYINNVALASLNLNHYRSHLGQSLTEETPFEGSILENLTFGDPNISDSDINWALDKCGLAKFVKEQPFGLKTMLYPEGRQLPLVIAKKIVLARSIIRKPKLLLLKDPLEQFPSDEATRIMDFLTEKGNAWSLVVVSNNPYWMKRSTRIITISNGKIVKETTPKEL
jgi:ABC-type bacteriocin/lantibiotic exporter with double-glycine peptidase domain